MSFLAFTGQSFSGGGAGSNPAGDIIWYLCFFWFYDSPSLILRISRYLNLAEFNSYIVPESDLEEGALRMLERSQLAKGDYHVGIEQC